MDVRGYNNGAILSCFSQTGNQGNHRVDGEAIGLEHADTKGPRLWPVSYRVVPRSFGLLPSPDHGNINVAEISTGGEWVFNYLSVACMISTDVSWLLQSVLMALAKRRPVQVRRQYCSTSSPRGQ